MSERRRSTAIAAVSDGAGGFSIREVEIDEPGPGEVQVEIRASGLCHTDVSMLTDGRTVIIGHEGAGVVAAIGAGVTRVVPGDRVMLNWARSCHRCWACKKGLTNLCRSQVPVHEGAHRTDDGWIGASFGLGTMASLALVHERAVTPIEVEIPWTSACLFGCCVMTGFGSVVNVARIEPGSSAVVIGAGAVGLCAIQGARIAGARTIVAVDINESKLDAARAFGATHTVLVDAGDTELLRAADEASALTDGGADYAFEATAIPELCTAPLRFIRNGGLAVQVSGTEERVTIDASAFFWDKRYLTSLYGRCDPDRDFPHLQRLYAEGTLDVDRLVTRTYPLRELGTAIDDLLLGKNTKSVIVPD
jgi:S-(hydroxymethyl)glutathione dehydrogenase / alcohol dehydrogenase